MAAQKKRRASKIFPPSQADWARMERRFERFIVTPNIADPIRELQALEVRAGRLLARSFRTGLRFHGWTLKGLAECVTLIPDEMEDDGRLRIGHRFDDLQSGGFFARLLWCVATCELAKAFLGHVREDYRHLGASLAEFTQLRALRGDHLRMADLYIDVCGLILARLAKELIKAAPLPRSKPRRYAWEAAGIKMEDPNRTDASIAEQLGISPSRLSESDYPRYCAMMGLSVKRPKGRVVKNRDGTTDIDAISDTDDRDSDWWVLERKTEFA